MSRTPTDRAAPAEAPGCEPRHSTLTPEVLTLVAERFRALSEPARLQILQCLLVSERTVGDLVETTGLGQANVSKHLQLLHSLHFVTRRKDGLFVYYALADESVFILCELMCGRLEAEMRARNDLLGGMPTASGGRSRRQAG